MSERICNCGPGHETVCHQFGTEPHFVGCPRWGEPLAAPDATAGGGLREVIAGALAYWYPDSGTGQAHTDDEHLAATDAVLALPALRDVLAAAARDAEKVRRVREAHPRHRLADWDDPCRICRALDAP